MLKISILDMSMKIANLYDMSLKIANLGLHPRFSQGQMSSGRWKLNGFVSQSGLSKIHEFEFERKSSDL